MADRLTSITLPGLPNGTGYAEWGRKTAPEMVAIIRTQAERMKADAEAILAAADEDFQIETYLGVHVKNKREVIQQSALKEPAHD